MTRAAGTNEMSTTGAPGGSAGADGRLLEGANFASPYPGLRPFEASEYSVFFGRAQQIADVKARLSEHRFVAVVGGSGCGKSSLVRAGIIPELQLGGIPGTGSFWVPVAFTPGTDPIGNLALSFSASLEPEPGSEARLDRIRYTLRQMNGLSALLAEFRHELRVEGGPPALRERANLLVLVDQFEEIFRRENEGKADVERLVRLIEDCYVRQDERIFMVLTMRSEDLHRCAAFPVLTAALNCAAYLVPRLDEPALEEIIVHPAQRYAARARRAAGLERHRAGVAFDPTVKRLIHGAVREMKGDPDHLPLLQHVLFRLWEHAMRRAGAPGVPADIGLADLAWATGHTVALLQEGPPAVTRSLLSRSLDHHAQRVFDGLDPTGQRVAETTFRLMGMKDERRNYKRSFTSREEIVDQSGADPAVVEAVVTRFSVPHPYVRDDAQHRAGAGMTGPMRAHRNDLDVSHEALIRNWNQLRTWIDSESERVQAYGELIQRFRGKERLERRDLRWMHAHHRLDSIGTRRGSRYAKELGLIRESAADRSNDSTVERTWAPTHERAIAFLVKSRRFQWLRRSLAVGAAVLLVVLGGAYAFQKYREEISLREARTFRSRIIAGETMRRINPSQAPEQRAVYLIETLVALGHLDEIADANGLGVGAGVDKLRLAIAETRTLIHRTLLSALASGVWPVKPEPEPIKGSYASPRLDGAERDRLCGGQLLGTAGDGRQLIVTQNGISYGRQKVNGQEIDCLSFEVLQGMPPRSVVKADSALKFLVARVPAPESRHGGGDSAHFVWQFWVVFWQCLKMEDGECQSWVARSREAGAFADVDVKGDVEPQWKVESSAGPRSGGVQDVVVSSLDPTTRKMHRRAYRSFSVEPTVRDPMATTGGPLAWTPLEAPSQPCLSEGAPPRADLSPGPARFTTVYQVHAGRCVEIRAATARFPEGWPYTFLIYPLDGAAKTRRPYPIAELTFTGPRLTAVRVETSSDGESDTLYVRSDDGQEFQLRSSVRELQDVACALLWGNKELPRERIDAMEWSRVYTGYVQAEGSLQALHKAPCKPAGKP